MNVSRRIPLGLVGGGPRSLIGGVHRAAAALSERFELKGGAFGTDVSRNRAHARALGLDPERAYAGLDEMLAAESRLAEGERIEVLAVLTPNHLHYPMVLRALESGLHVICEKPFTMTASEALELERRARDGGRKVCIAHTYTGYPMVRQMRAMIAAGEIGALQKIDAQYYQGWINAAMHDAAMRQSIWRLDPARSGPSCCYGDIGVHAFNLAEYTTGLRIARVLADLDTFRPDNALDVDGTTLLRTACGVHGVLRASQIATGEENGVQIAVYGSRGALKWSHETPAILTHLREDAPRQVFTPGQRFNAELARTASQLPPGHPQGLAEAMANLYRGFADAIHGVPGAEERFPGIEAGVRGMRFIEATLASTRAGQSWMEISA
jgi:predicted dehydrogenase